MNVEIEAKMRLANPDALRDRLQEAGGLLKSELTETNIYFDTADGMLKSSDQGLRIRVERDETSGDHRVIITHKGPRVHGKLKSRSESELDVADAGAAVRLLSVLGYQPGLTFDKRRQRYTMDNCRIELDTLPYLGQFVEIEGETEDAVMNAREKLGLADQPLIRTSYIAMLSTYLHEHKISDRVIKLQAPVPA